MPYGVHPQPTYQAHHLQGPWGQDQVGQQYAYSASPQPLPQTSWTPSPPVHSPPPQQSRDPEHQLASIGHHAPSYKTGIVESEKREKFKPSPKYNDLWAMFAFLFQMVAFMVLSAFTIKNIIKTAVITSADKGTAEKDFFLTTNVMVSFTLGIGISVVYSYIYLLVTNVMPLWSMSVTYWFLMFVFFGVSGFHFYSKNWFNGVLLFVIGALFAKAYWSARERILASAVLTNIVHVTISGVFAAHYFKSLSGSPTWTCLKRSCTTSFGTICFGGLIYAIVQTIKQALDFLRGGNNILACAYEGCFHYINKALESITPLVFCEVAIYGKPFLPAANDAFKIVKDRGLDAVLNEIIISTVWSIGAFFGAYVSAISTQEYLMMVMGGRGTPDVKHHTLQIWIVTGLVFVLSMQVMFTAGAVVHSGVATIFIALAENPDALAEAKPKFFAKIQAAYPDMLKDDDQ
ncbi:putative choline transporter, neither null mutation nor overexpression affects choline transport [Mortierella alpina]|nr:putative choline transporter, neither null mutation nor overexpression affects choline transport [Mortierella alpina]